jgi:glycosyltransferase involved in cell wall biosynthesis
MITQFYAPVVGGEERMVENLSASLVRRGHSVSVATLFGAEHDDGVRVHRIRASAMRMGRLYAEAERPHAPPLPDPEAMRALRAIVEDERPDVVHGHNWLAWSYLPLRRRARAPLVLSLHDYSLVCATKRLMRHGVPCSGPSVARCLPCAGRQYGAPKGVAIATGVRVGAVAVRARADLLLPVSEQVARACGLHGGATPFEVMPNFVPDGLGDAAVSGDGRLPPPGFVLFVGDATVDKGIDVLLDAHRRLESKLPLVIAGRRFGRETGPGVQVLGVVEHGLVLEAMRRAAVVVVPSLVPETFGMVALEAMALGRPVIASRLGEPGSPAALAAALERVLVDGAGTEQMASRAARRGESLSESVVVPRVERAYRSVVEKT